MFIFVYILRMYMFIFVYILRMDTNIVDCTRTNVDIR